MVEISALEPRPVRRGKARPAVKEISKDELLLQQLAESIPDEITEDNLFNSDTAREMGYEKIDDQHEVNAYRIRPGRIVMFKVDKETGRVYRRIVPSRNMLMNLRNGWLARCPECNTDCSPNPNECPHRVKTKNYKLAAKCPVCTKRFYDPGPLPKHEEVEDEPGMVNFDDFEDSAEARLKSLRDDHIRAWHPTIARRMGLFASVGSA